MSTPHAELLAFALSYPESTQEMPWGHPVVKVRGKSFVFMSNEGEALSLSVKLPESNAAALMLPFASPTGYGLGKSGWVSARFEPGAPVPVDMLCEWIDESFRAVAPKRLVKQLPARE